MEKINIIRSMNEWSGKIVMGVGAVIMITSCSIFSSDSGSKAQIFPNKVGNLWTYQYTNNRSGETGTISVEIVGEDTLPDGRKANLWQYTYPEHYIDTLWVVSDDTSAIGYYRSHHGSGKYFNEEFTFIFPLYIGNSWGQEALPDSMYKVLEKTTVILGEGLSYNDVFKLSRTKPFFANFFIYDTLWYKNEIGIVKNIQRRYNLGAVGNSTWELVSYELK